MIAVLARMLSLSIALPPRLNYITDTSFKSPTLGEYLNV